MKKYIIPIFLFVVFWLAVESLIVYGQCTVTQSAPVVQDTLGNASVSLHFVYGLAQTADINCNIPIGAEPNYIADFSSNTCTNLEAQAVAVANAPGVGGIISTTGTVRGVGP